MELIGFYVYHSNREKITQNEGPVRWDWKPSLITKVSNFASSVSGYSGWEAVGHDDPFYWIVRLKKNPPSCRLARGIPNRHQ